MVTMQQRVIVWRLTGSSREGEWFVPPPGWNGKVYVPGLVAWRAVRMVPTGDVEWDGNRCAEVWVPEDRMDVWVAEHRID